MDEQFFTGYCRVLDGSRLVTAEKEDGVWEFDCQFPDCPYAPNCRIAESLRSL